MGSSGAIISSGTALHIADTGFIATGGTYSADNTAWVQVGTDLTVPAATGDHLEIIPDLLAGNESTAVIFDAATRKGGVDTNWFSTATNTPRYTGSDPNGYLDSSAPFTGPRTISYIVQAGDISGGNVTVRYYMRSASGTARTVNKNSTYPARLILKNLGQGT